MCPSTMNWTLVPACGLGSFWSSRALRPAALALASYHHACTRSEDTLTEDEEFLKEREREGGKDEEMTANQVALVGSHGNCLHAYVIQ